MPLGSGTSKIPVGLTFWAIFARFELKYNTNQLLLVRNNKSYLNFFENPQKNGRKGTEPEGMSTRVWKFCVMTIFWPFLTTTDCCRYVYLKHIRFSKRFCTNYLKIGQKRWIWRNFQKNIEILENSGARSLQVRVVNLEISCRAYLLCNFQMVWTEIFRKSNMFMW